MRGRAGLVAGLAGAIVAWISLYLAIESLSEAVTGLLHLQGHLGSAVGFFRYEAPKVLLLLVAVLLGVGIVRSFFTPERTRRLLAGRRESAGNVLGALLGVVTPFCSCSAVPLFIGFVTAGVPLGVTFSSLVSAPMANEVALVLLLGLFGWKVAALYLGTGLAVAVAAGWTIGRLKLEGWVEPAKCQKLYAVAGRAIGESGIPATIVKVEDIRAIMAFRVMMTPALVIDGEVKASGRIPSVAEMVGWIRARAAATP